MKMVWVILAEGIAQDARNAISLIGVQQNIQPAPELPVTTKRAVLANVEFGEDAPTNGQKYTVRFTVTSPSGHIILAQGGQGAYSGSPWKEVNAGISVMGEFPLTLTEYGRHVVSVDVESDSHGAVRGTADLHVVPLPDQQE